jgi:hypothetical protein
MYGQLRYVVASSGLAATLLGTRKGVAPHHSESAFTSRIAVTQNGTGTMCSLLLVALNPPPPKEARAVEDSTSR